MLKLAYNTTDSAIVVDDAGYSIGGREWGGIDTMSSIGSTELDAGRCVLVDEDAARNSGNPAVQSALWALDVRRERAEAAAALDKDELVEALPAEVVDALPVGASGEPAKADLVEAAVADPEVALEAPKKSTSRTAAKK